MLEIQHLESPQDWQKIIPNFNPQTDTWIVADLKAKLEVQQKLFKKYNFLPEEANLRASEMWLHIYKRLGLETQIITLNFAKVYLTEQLEQEEEHWLKVPGAHKTLLEYIKQLFPLIIYPHSEELMGAWWRENNGSLLRWGRWFYYAQKYVQKFLDQGWILPTWIPYILFNDHLHQINWDRKIIIDLGSQLTQTEALLFRQLSESTDVTVMTPKKISQGEFFNIDRNYSRLFDSKKIVTDKSSSYENVTFKRFTTSLGEVKDLSAQVREWIQQGFKPSEITVSAPDIEYYWPVLSAYFEIENIPVQKSKVVRAQSFLPIMAWLARLKIELGKISSEDIELDIFSDFHQIQDVSHLEFKKLYSLILDDNQIHRLKEVSHRYKFSMDSKTPINLDQFLLWAIRHLREFKNTQPLESLLRTLLQDNLQNIKLKPTSWLRCLEDAAAKTEISVCEEQFEGVFVENLRSARHLNTPCLYVFGLSESQVKSVKMMGLKASEVLSIENDLGFVLDLPESQELEFDADWLLQSQCTNIIASFSETNFAGEIDAASMIWLKPVKQKTEKYDIVDLPKLSYWDFLQKKLTTIHNSKKAQFIDRDLGKVTLPSQKLNKISALSVSRLEKYSQCPFVFMSESLFKLRDPQILDLDLDPMAFGQFMHKVFQYTISEPFKGDWTDPELMEVFEKSKQDVKLPLFDEKTWFRIQRMMLKIIKQFINFETDWRKTYPQTKTIGREVELKSCWDQNLKDFIELNDEKGIVFRGSIDRIDVDEENYAVVLDYKSSKNQLSNYNNWLENDQIQLSIYAYLVEKGFTGLGKPLKVFGMGYIAAKDCERNKGLWCEEADNKLFTINNRSRNSMTKQELSIYWEKVKNRVYELVEKISEGEFQPLPKDIKECGKCNWRKICRAPHLN
ncbi:MAG: PD-(D/E)XK nuclease family protein [Bdellovibrionales bacterium]|nr:PD-(D/E)XK nuclease family protein [Bdellovibrionales bacterium]